MSPAIRLFSKFVSIFACLFLAVPTFAAVSDDVDQALLEDFISGEASAEDVSLSLSQTMVDVKDSAYMYEMIGFIIQEVARSTALTNEQKVDRLTALRDRLKVRFQERDHADQFFREFGAFWGSEAVVVGSLLLFASEPLFSTFDNGLFTMGAMFAGGVGATLATQYANKLGWFNKRYSVAKTARMIDTACNALLK